jgi:hypothetical protein
MKTSVGYQTSQSSTLENRTNQYQGALISFISINAGIEVPTLAVKSFCYYAANYGSIGPVRLIH